MYANMRLSKYEYFIFTQKFRLNELLSCKQVATIEIASEVKAKAYAYTISNHEMALPEQNNKDILFKIACCAFCFKCRSS